MSLPPKRKEPSLALEVVQTTTQPLAVARTPEQARVESVNALLSSAYERASALELSKEEIAALTADFTDGCFRRGAGGDDNLIYLEPMFLTQRLNEVLGLGKWALVIRRSWNEEYKTGKGEQAVRVYIDGVLIIRKCYVSEAIGDMSYFKNNAKTNFGDSYEGASTAALRRCCKKIGVGLQCFSKDWCEAWKKKYSGFKRPEK